MASGKGNLLLENISGRLGKDYIVKQYSGKIVIAMFPRKYKHRTTELTKLYEARFKEAIKYAQSILRRPGSKAAYKDKLQPGQRLYNYLISEYMQEEKRKSSIPSHNQPQVFIEF